MKDGYPRTPFELFTGESIDYLRDFRCRWGELVIVRKPKGISSDLHVTGEWAMVVRRFMNKSGVLKVFLIGSRKYAYRLSFRRAKVPDWVITAMNSIGEKSIGFEDQHEGTETNETRLIDEDVPEGPQDHPEYVENDAEDHLEQFEGDNIDDLNDVIRVLEEDGLQIDFEEEPHVQDVETRARADPNRFQIEQDADRYAEYVAMGWREPEPQDVGRVVFSRGFKRTDANLIRAREILRNSYLSRQGGEVGGAEQANVYFVQAMKTRPEAAWDALLKEILKGDSKKIWHGEHIENLSADERKLILPMMKTGRIETNLLEWERSWKNVKILEYLTRFANELRLGVRDNYTLDQILGANVMLPEVDTAREYWTPTPEQNAELISIEDLEARTARSNELFKPG